MYEQTLRLLAGDCGLSWGVDDLKYGLKLKKTNQVCYIAFASRGCPGDNPITKGYYNHITVLNASEAML
jgi:hypothetical protein